MPGIDYHQLRQQIKMREVLDLIGFQATWRHGPQVRGPCPIPGCRSTSPRPFSVHLDRQAYRCFACGGQGNALDLWAAIHGLPLYRAALQLCHALHLDPAWLGASLIPSRRRLRRVASRAPLHNH